MISEASISLSILHRDLHKPRIYGVGETPGGGEGGRELKARNSGLIMIGAFHENCMEKELVSINF